MKVDFSASICYAGVMAKERIYLTDITLHVRECRQTLSFAKVAPRGRMYSPMTKPVTNGAKDTGGTFKFSFNLPQDLHERIMRDEVELMIPQSGLQIHASADTIEFVKAREQKTRRELIHRGRTWHSDGMKPT